MERIRQDDKFGPVAGVDRNVILLSPTYLGARQNESGAVANLADHSRAIGELLVKLSAEIATLNTTDDLSGEMECVALGFSRLGKTFETAGMALDQWLAPRSGV